jgi:hypothetical protein
MLVPCPRNTLAYPLHDPAPRREAVSKSRNIYTAPFGGTPVAPIYKAGQAQKRVPAGEIVFWCCPVRL